MWYRLVKQTNHSSTRFCIGTSSQNAFLSIQLIIVFASSWSSNLGCLPHWHSGLSWMVRAAWIDILKPQAIRNTLVVIWVTVPMGHLAKTTRLCGCQLWGSPTLTLSSAETARSSSCPWATRYPISQNRRNAITGIWGVRDIRLVVEWALQYNGRWKINLSMHNSRLCGSKLVSVYAWYRVESFEARAKHSDASILVPLYLLAMTLFQILNHHPPRSLTRVHHLHGILPPLAPRLAKVTSVQKWFLVHKSQTSSSHRFMDRDHSEMSVDAQALYNICLIVW